jgi:hypothetical protein
MENKILQALISHYNAQVHRAEVNLVNYFKNPVGIGEHPDIIGEMIKLVDAIAAAKDSLEILNGYIQQPKTESTNTLGGN